MHPVSSCIAVTSIDTCAAPGELPVKAMFEKASIEVFRMCIVVPGEVSMSWRLSYLLVCKNLFAYVSNQT